MSEDVRDPHNLALRLEINDCTVQEDSTANMYYKIPQILEYVTQFMTLNVGDLILLGTPHGVGPIRVFVNKTKNGRKVTESGVHSRRRIR